MRIPGEHLIQVGARALRLACRFAPGELDEHPDGRFLRRELFLE
jgi:hypothetical protein